MLFCIFFKCRNALRNFNWLKSKNWYFERFIAAWISDLVIFFTKLRFYFGSKICRWNWQTFLNVIMYSVNCVLMMLCFQFVNKINSLHWTRCSDPSEAKYLWWNWKRLIITPWWIFIMTGYFGQNLHQMNFSLFPVRIWWVTLYVTL